MATSDKETIVVEAQCYCKSLHYKLSLKASDLPLGVHMCHCSICRWTHGTLATFHAQLPDGVGPEFISPSGLDKLTPYRFPASQNIRYFCSTCGCHMGDVSSVDGNWVVSTSLFAKNENVFQFRSHVLTESALGGGLNEWLPKIGDREMKVWNPNDGSAAPKHSEAEHDSNGEDRLIVQCHCEGVSFTIPRPTEEVISDPFMSRFVSSVDKSKWVATVDACDDCRLVSGAHVISWTFVPLDFCEPKIGPDLMLGTMKTFVSSPGVLRSFCGVCGATVFYSCDDRRPTVRQNIVDIAVGILRAPEGSRAENWLTWRAGQIGFVDSGLRYDEEFTKSLGQGLHDWSMAKYGYVLTKEV